MVLSMRHETPIPPVRSQKCSGTSSTCRPSLSPMNTGAALSRLWHHRTQGWALRMRLEERSSECGALGETENQRESKGLTWAPGCQRINRCVAKMFPACTNAPATEWHSQTAEKQLPRALAEHKSFQDLQIPAFCRYFLRKNYFKC